jgi:SPP1 gp7 family putative phage head morphogenesis protein
VWYQRFAKNNGITLQEAKQWLNAKELAEFKWDVDEYIKHGQENAITGEWMKELENASAKYHISRLDALKLQCQQDMEVLFGNQLDTLDETMRDVYKAGYYHTAFEVQKGVGVGWSFSVLDDKTIDKVINRPWASDGSNFSDRVWANKDKLVTQLNTTLTQSIITGQDPQKAINTISKQLDVSKNVAGRMVMTEQAYFSSEAQKDCFKELDVDQYEIVATLDSVTSDLCRSMDGRVFNMSEWEVGVTAPPFHPWCRTTTVPYFDDEFDVGERVARDENGKTYTVPANMKYKDWEKSFVDGDTSGLKEAAPGDTIKAKGQTFEAVEDTQAFAEMQSYMKDNYGIAVDDSVGALNFQSVREGVQGIEYVMREFPQAQASFKTIATDKRGLMCAGYGGGISFNPEYYKTREDALLSHGIGEGAVQTGLHPKGNNCFGSGAHEAGHILEKALIDKDGGESAIGVLSWSDCTYAKAIVSDACKAAKKLPECKGMTIPQLRGAISNYARDYDESECLAEAVCDYSLNGEDAAVLSKIIWGMLKKELG